ncbi:unnamed protein product [Haemonchus placei]|uniref:PH domain-containing protein n=1 Tax=Haemonchus placei TaxID=6290 RepID=A0A0N4X7D0_HAEPC|nr:unnamed protein product [Haemonchus placei]
MSSFTIMPTDEYIASLNIPNFRFDYEDEDQLRIHLMCAMLCCPKQVDEDGCIRADLVNRNAEEITGGFMDLYTIGRKATKEDENEFKKITMNLERLFQHPMFSKIVTMDGQAKFHAVPPEPIRGLYEKIIRGGRQLRWREGQKMSQKEREANTPEAVYISKVACNFLMELIEKERQHRGLRMVEWQSIQKRYCEMVTNPDSEDKELMEFYKEKYGMDFSSHSLNGDVIKRWTTRSQVMKGLTMPLFRPIHLEKRGEIIFVGFNDDAVLYSDEELQRDKELWQMGARPKERRYERERPKPVEPNRIEPFLPSDPSQSPFAKKAEPRQMPRQQFKPERVSIYDGVEPEYTPKSAAPQDDVPDSDSDSDDLMNETGVYSDEERPPNKEESKTRESEFGATNDWKSKQPAPAPKPNLHSSTSNRLGDGPPPQSPSMMRQPANIGGMPQSCPNRWEMLNNEMPEVVKPAARYERPSSSVPHAPVKTESSSNAFAQPPPSSVPRHRSAFEACKSNTGTQEVRNESRQLRENDVPLDRDTRSQTRNQYDRRVNDESQQSQHERIRDNEFQQDRDEYRRDDGPFSSRQGSSGRESRIREEQNFRYRTDRHADNGYYDAREPSRNSRPTTESGRNLPYPDLPPGSVFNRIFDESCIRRPQHRVSSRNTVTGEMSPPISQRFGYDNTNSRAYADNERTLESSSRQRNESRDYDRREDRNNCRDSSYPAHVDRETEHDSRKSSVSNRQDSRLQNVQAPVNNVNEASDSFRRLNQSSALSSLQSLEPDEQACLRMIRDFAFVHRNVISSGFRPLGSVLSLFPTSHDVDYWVQQIRAHLPEVEVVPFRDTFVVVWKEGASSN